MASRNRFQFSIRRLILLTTVVAGFAAFAIRIDSLTIAICLFGSYFVFVATWAIFRGPLMVSEFRNLSRRKKQNIKRRHELESEVSEIKQRPTSP